MLHVTASEEEEEEEEEVAKLLGLFQLDLDPRANLPQELQRILDGIGLRLS